MAMPQAPSQEYQMGWSVSPAGAAAGASSVLVGSAAGVVVSVGLFSSSSSPFFLKTALNLAFKLLSALEAEQDVKSAHTLVFAVVGLAGSCGSAGHVEKCQHRQGKETCRGVV